MLRSQNTDFINSFYKALNSGIAPSQILNYFQETPAIKDWLAPLFEMQFLEELLLKYHPNEIIFHGKNCLEVRNPFGKQVLNYPMTDEELCLCFEWLALREGTPWNMAHPVAHFKYQLSQFHLRISLLQNSLSLRTHKYFIRILHQKNFHLSDFQITTSIEKQIVTMLQAKRNIIISGATESGKTTLLNTLLNKLPTSEHIISLEDTEELKLTQPTHTQLIGTKTFNLKKLLHFSLRLSPDRLVMGELRGSEIEAFILAQNTGHKGLMATVHANSARDALVRLGTLFELSLEKTSIPFETIMKLICQNIDYVIHIENKRIKELIKVHGHDQGQCLYDFVA
ncbi:MAG: Flp pilus assembly complex ATPase component TadA [Halobacteriovoraceae bacterium]|nr:Flp pilus assembly complex ATPase component TadA [Halobacteriovoraceae bacterium]MCB9093798.1 Flp pilus assembly complex ATPase component TadA [Halobacteriovoraceae bacterium]